MSASTAWVDTVFAHDPDRLAVIAETEAGVVGRVTYSKLQSLLLITVDVSGSGEGKPPPVKKCVVETCCSRLSCG